MTDGDRPLDAQIGERCSGFGFCSRQIGVLKIDREGRSYKIGGITRR